MNYKKIAAALAAGVLALSASGVSAFAEAALELDDLDNPTSLNDLLDDENDELTDDEDDAIKNVDLAPSLGDDPVTSPEDNADDESEDGDDITVPGVGEDTNKDAEPKVEDDKDKKEDEPKIETKPGGTVVAPESTYTIKLVTYEDVENYVKALLYDGVQIVPGSIKLNCSSLDQIAVFTNANKVLGYNTGLALTSGIAAKAFDSTEDKIASNDLGTNVYTDQDLQALFPGRQLNDTVSLEFKIIANGEDLNFNYNLFSTEFSQNEKYRDSFGLFVNGENIAFLPNGDPVNVDSLRSYVNANGNKIYIEKKDNNDIGNFEGISHTLKCSKKVAVGEEVTIKLVVADTGDHIRDTLIAIQSGSVAFIPEAVEGTFETSGNISNIPLEENDITSDKINKAPFEIKPTEGYTSISTDGEQWASSVTVSQPGTNVPFSFYLKDDNGKTTQKKTIYYTLDLNKEPVITPDKPCPITDNVPLLCDDDIGLYKTKKKIIVEEEKKQETQQAANTVAPNAEVIAATGGEVEHINAAGVAGGALAAAILSAAGLMFLVRKNRSR